MRLSFALLALLLAPLAAVHSADAPQPVKVFILAGQSNMEGQAVVDLAGKDYNQGKGTLELLMADPTKAAMFKHLKDAAGRWTVREDVWVRYQQEDRPLLAGPLTFGFSVYGDPHHFGPELQFGHVLGDYFENPVLLIKTAWGGKSLFKDFRPPSSGGEVGKYYTLMIAQVREALVNMEKEFPAAKGRGYELAGFVWYQGWNDGVNPKTAVPEYEQNLVNLIKDVRREFNAPKLPVVIGELTGPWVQAEGAWDALRKAQATAAAKPDFAGNVLFVPTHDFVRKPEDSPNPTHGHHEFGNAETYFLVGDALGKAMITLLKNQILLPAVAEEPRAKRLPTLFIIGDSTVKNGSGKGAGGLWGWGDFLADHLDKTSIAVDNRALGGRSSRTFITEGRWDAVLAAMQPGDFVLMQFGHNDGGPVNTGRARASLKGNGDETQEVIMEATKKSETVHSYGWYMRKYITDTKAKGATPVVLSPIPRNMWSEGKVNRAARDYGKWAAEVAQSTGAFFVDLNDIVAKHYETEGPAKVLEKYFTAADHTHTTEAGAKLNAASVIEGLKALKECPLTSFIK